MKYLIDNKEQEKQHRRSLMFLDAVIVLSIIGILCIGIFVIRMYLPSSDSRVYNCSIAEIHPDFTPAMREACREQLRRK